MFELSSYPYTLPDNFFTDEESAYYANGLPEKEAELYHRINTMIKIDFEGYQENYSHEDKVCYSIEICYENILEMILRKISDIKEENYYISKMNNSDMEKLNYYDSLGRNVRFKYWYCTKGEYFEDILKAI